MIGKHIKIQKMGDAVLGVELEGNPEKPEPIHFRVVLPFGDVDICRCADNTYWIHIRNNHPEDGKEPGRLIGQFMESRIDACGRHSRDVDATSFKEPGMYHMAVKVGPKQEVPNE